MYIVPIPGSIGFGVPFLLCSDPPCLHVDTAQPRAIYDDGVDVPVQEDTVPTNERGLNAVDPAPPSAVGDGADLMRAP